MYMHICIYMHIDVCVNIYAGVSSRVVLDSLFQKELRITDPKWKQVPLPKPQHAFACKEKNFELFLPLQVQNLN